MGMETTVQKHGSKAEDMRKRKAHPVLAFLYIFVIILLLLLILLFLFLPVVRHKAVAKVSNIGNL
jgi:type VI protein secretion system component VasF